MVGNVGTLPSFPKAFQEISSCLKHPSATVTEAARIISRDVAMTANIMNSSFLPSSARAGTSPVLIVPSPFWIGYLKRARARTRTVSKRWFKCDRSSLVTQLEDGHRGPSYLLHEKLPASRVDEAFSTGMLHDVGRVIFASRMSEAGGQVGLIADTVMRVDQHHAEVVPIYWDCGDFRATLLQRSHCITHRVYGPMPASI